LKSKNADDVGNMGDRYAEPDEEGVYDYKIETPMKFVFSGAYLFGKQALVSVDYELVDYASAKLKSNYSGDDFTDKNRKIKDALTSAGNLRIGGEYRVSPTFSLRAGYENFGTAFKSEYMGKKNPNADAKSSTISAGFGVRQGNVFFDAAFKHMTAEEYQNIYPDSPRMAKFATNQNSVIFTIGYKF
jgi:long-subunit fatty acid transport protein